jgi:serine/threonine protein phosphatase 1
MFDNTLRFKVPLENPYGRRFVITDIHGCYKSFKSLLNKISLSKADHLFLLGDYINRGPCSQLVLDLILDLLDSGYQIFPLRGNHEQLLLDSKTRQQIENTPQMPKLHKYKGLLNENGSLKTKYLDFINTLPYYFELNNYFLVHAGFNFDQNNPFNDYFSMLWITEFKIKKEIVGTKKIIHGHIPNDLNVILKCLDNKSQIISLDNGCYIKKDRQKGNLLSLELDSLVLSIQNNIEE